MAIELPEWINNRTVERAYARAIEAQRRHKDNWAETGMRAARARDPRLMLVLERGSNIMTMLQEAQIGEYRRRGEASIPFSHTVELTEVQLWTKAFTFADKGEPLEQLKWIYGCAAELAGLQS